ncbi:hypothetical protein N0V82_002329 [Gnomoniopsis sp. IMI 355080]|nr:hypothetical protein N0V82_002329 [Gnomoniopsis sp. IMI 355080]
MAVGLLPPKSCQLAANVRPQARPDHFQGLVDTLKEALGPSSGLDSSDVDVKALVKAMRAYDAKERGWVPYALADPELGYTRNLVDEGNGKSNLLVLVWTPGKGSPIHDHGNAHCIMKILHGNLTESRYEFPNSDKEQPMELIREATYKENQVAYMADELGLHKMENRGDDYAISLHCERSYVPKCGYYSKFAEKV